MIERVHVCGYVSTIPYIFMHVSSLPLSPPTPPHTHSYTHTLLASLTDIWALGILLFEILFGSHPFLLHADQSKQPKTANNNPHPEGTNGAKPTVAKASHPEGGHETGDGHPPSDREFTPVDVWKASLRSPARLPRSIKVGPK